MSCDSFLAGESDPVVGGQTPFADRGGQWFRGRTNPDCQKRLPVELPGAVAPSGRRVLYGLLLKQEYIEVVESFFGRAVSIAVWFPAKGLTPSLPRVAAIEKELTLFQTTLLCEA